MNNPPAADARALRATASAFETQRNKLPVPGDPHRFADTVAVARQISQLGTLITTLGDQVLFRANAETQAPHSAKVITGFASAAAPVGEAVAALGEAAHQLAFLGQTEHLHEQVDARDARQAAVRVREYALNAADTALREAAGTLHAAATTASPLSASAASAQLRAARHRSMRALPASGPVPPASAPAAATPRDRITRSR